MYEPVQKCTHCGANLRLDDLRKPNCPYCGTVLPHHAQAAQHAQVVNQVMGQMMAQQAQAEAAWRGAYGVGPTPPAPGGPPPGATPPPGAMPPTVPYGAPPPYAPGPYADPQRIAAAHMVQVAGIGRTITIVVAASVIFALLLTAGIVAWALLRV